MPKSLALLLLIPIIYMGYSDATTPWFPISDSWEASKCHQPPSLTPTAAVFQDLDSRWSSEPFKAQAVEWLSGAVQVETESYDGMGEVGDDERWEKFAAFHDYLAKAFPLVQEKLELFKVNKFGLIYEWTGTDKSLKPLLLTGHQDVVPVDKSSYDQWNHPPFSGYYDGEYVWGRGSIDDKSGLIGILSSLEFLLATDFVPRRTIVLASGMDEEASGTKGAGHLGPYLQDTYGRFALLVDEGGGFADVMGRLIAAPATSEKGYYDVRVTVETLGGHSSVPPDHTSIGLLSLLLAHFEANPHEPNFTRENPTYTLMSCAAHYAPDLDHELRRLLKKSAKSDKALQKAGLFLSKSRETRPYVGTTQAIDLISGGVKVNALPERASAVVNHRINVASSISSLQYRTTSLILPLVKSLNLSLTTFGEDLHLADGGGAGRVVLESAFGNSLEPAPITPTTPETMGWQVLAGTIKSVHAARLTDGLVDVALEEEILVSPAIMSGNTDTRYYWALTDQIYRYGHLNPADFYVESGIHSVNEALKATAFVNLIRFFGTLILNADEADF